MRTTLVLLRVALVLSLPLVFSCTTLPENRSGGDAWQPRSKPVQVTQLFDGRLRLDFEPLPPDLVWETLRVEDARAELAEFHRALRPAFQPRFRRVTVSSSSWNASTGTPAAWEQQLRQDFLSRFGESLLPLPDTVENSRLYMALKLSTRYMGPGLRDAAMELFNSPAFLTSVTLSVLVYFSAWVLPEPFFSKTFAVALTIRLALAVGLLELSHLARACVRLYREVDAAVTMAELEAVAERFGRAMGGTALRVLVIVAGAGIGRALPNVPEGGLGALLMPPRYAAVGNLVVEGTATAHVVADGTLVIAGAAVGTAASVLGADCNDENQSVAGYSRHHLATDKNDTSAVRGGPWTPLFALLFAQAGMSLDDPANIVQLKGHYGPHPQEYHEEVYRRLRFALLRCPNEDACRGRLAAELRRIAKEVCTPGSLLNNLLTK
ncbi:hypothetical protein F0U63_02405 [Cystobacter fuscus]|nr:hypothetical protein F0U63_02405 [Cystobacter fuscus]